MIVRSFSGKAVVVDIWVRIPRTMYFLTEYYSKKELGKSWKLLASTTDSFFIKKYGGEIVSTGLS